MKRLRPLLILLVPVLIILSGCARARPEAGQPEPTPTPPPAESVLDDSSRAAVTEPATTFAPGQVLVKFARQAMPDLPTQKEEHPQALSIGSASLDPLFAKLGITGLEPLLAPIARATGERFESLSARAGEASQFYLASLDPTKSIEEVVRSIAQSDEVEYAEPNYMAYATGRPAALPHPLTPGDPFFQYQWNMEAIQMPRAWDVSTGSGVTVAVLDTGVAYETFDMFVQAPDLSGTQFVPGYDFVNNDAHPNDDNGHGTHVAGTIAQTTNNGEGVAGVAYNARLMPVKVLDGLGQGSYATIIQGINYAVENGAQVINLSLSGHSRSQALEDAINQARARGVVVVAAAGNNGGAIEYPARYDNAIAVGAVRLDKSRARYSNFGPQLDLVAPGGDNQIDQNNDGFGDGIVQQTFKPGEINTFRYLFMEGTSMAAPHVSGVAALLLAKAPDLSPDRVEQAIESTALDLGPSGTDPEYGVGLIQAAAALAAIGAVPSPVPPTATPVGPTATPLPGQTPSPTPPPAPTPAPTATTAPPAPAGDLIINGSFEQTAGWEFRWTPSQGRYTTERAHSGSRAAVVGITDPALDRFSYSSVAQKVTIPSGARRATLTAYVYPVTQETPGGDVQIVMLLDANFRVLKQLSSRLSNAQTWQEQTFDLTGYAGQTVYVYFGAVNVRTNGKVTAMYVDDVSLVVEK